MPVDSFKPRGTNKLNRPTRDGGGSKNYPIIGIVKNNIDANRSGKIWVALQDGKGPTNPNSRSGWTQVQYLSSFFGVVQANGGANDLGSYTNNSSSYGHWQAPPDIGTAITILNTGAADTTISATTPGTTTVTSAGATSAQPKVGVNKAAVCIKTAANTWRVVGAVS